MADSETLDEGPSLRRDLAASVADGAAFGVMVGLGETYVPAFTLEVGLGQVFAGMVSTVPLLIGSLLQLISPWAIQRLHSHRNWVVLCAGLQGLCFIPLVIAALSGEISAWWALVVTSIYWGAGLATGPAWNTWQGTIIPRSIRTQFFARRSKLQQIATLAGFLTGGLSLQWGRLHGCAFEVFATLFGVATICRLISTLSLALQSEPVPMPTGVQDRSNPQSTSSIAQILQGPTGALLAFAVVMQAGVYVSGPFFNPYILKVLNFTYAGYATLLGTSFVAKFVCLPLWGNFAHKAGAQRLLWVGTFGVIPLAIGWVVSDNFWYLLVLQIFAGSAWGAYELALMLLFFETIPEDRRTSILTLYNVANSVALALGSVVGALTLYVGHVSPEAYLWAFGLSTVVRALGLFWLFRLPTVHVSAASTPMRPLTVRPSSGSIDDPILSTLPDQRD